MIRKYHNHKLQTTPWHREEEPLNHHETPGRQIKQSNQLSLPHQDNVKPVSRHFTSTTHTRDDVKAVIVAQTRDNFNVHLRTKESRINTLNTKHLNILKDEQTIPLR